MREGMEILVLGRGNPSPWDAGPSNPLCFSPPKQAVVSSEPNFWTHSLQIHCKGPGPKTATLQKDKKEKSKGTCVKEKKIGKKKEKKEMPCVEDKKRGKKKEKRRRKCYHNIFTINFKE